MSFGIKMCQIWIFATIVSILIFSAKNQAYSQESAQAVMNVRVQVISSSEVNTKIEDDIADQLKEPAENFSIGEFSMKFPEGMGYSITVDPVLKMEGNTHSWDIDISVQQKTDNQVKHTFNFTGNSRASKITSGKYAGELVTKIEYL